MIPKNIFSKLNNKKGIWYPPNSQSDISYPEDGNSICYQIENDSFWFKHRNLCILSVLNSFLPVSQLFCDLGGGNGFVSKFLQQNGYTVCLIEPGTIGAQNAQKQGVKLIINSTLENLTEINLNFPAIGMFDVLEHIEDDLKFLKQVHSSLEENGLLVFTVPAFNSLWSENDNIAGHYRRYTLQTAENVLQKANFSVEYKTYMFSPLYIPLFLFRSLPSRFGFINKNNVRNKTLSHHKKENSILKKLLSSELKDISNLKSKTIGSSCLIVARKN